MMALIMGSTFQVSAQSDFSAEKKQEEVEEALYDDEGNDEGAELSETEEIDGFETILCSAEADIEVKSEDLKKILFTAKNGEDVKVFQGWGENSITVNGVTYIKINFIGKDGFPEIGFVPSSLVKAKSQCEYVAQENEDETEIFPSLENTVKDLSITGIDDENCCIFPTTKKVRASFTEGMRKFGARRNKGARVHAAVDLYRFLNEPLVSVAPGKVIRNLYYFYQGTFALEVVHTGGFVVRYGELTSKVPKGVKRNKRLAMGEQLGFMGKINSKGIEPMLHFELYKGTLNGPLTQNGIGGPDNLRYNRRNDLMNPTPYLLKWEAKQFTE